MALFRVFVADKITKFPLAYYETRSNFKFTAKRKVIKYVLNNDKSYIVTATRIKGGKKK